MLSLTLVNIGESVSQVLSGTEGVQPTPVLEL